MGDREIGERGEIERKERKRRERERRDRETEKTHEASSGYQVISTSAITDI